jgi:Zn-dependent protease with chaperone function
MSEVLGSVDGFWYDSGSSKRLPCRLDVFANGDLVVCDKNDRRSVHQSHWQDMTLSSRLGNTPRYLEFSDGQKFETLENDTIDQLERQLRVGGVSQSGSSLAAFIHLLESKIRYGLLALLVVIAFGSWMTVYGVPAASKWIAYQLPGNVLTIASEQTMSFLDGGVFQESTLSSEVRERVQQHFLPTIRQYPDLNIRVHFRDGADLGANAFALPDGTVVFTDQMVRLAKNDDELLAVLAHEIGHVHHRHGMRSLVQSSMLAFLLMMMSGDVGATAEIFLALPIFLTEMAYSRDFERESDDFALDYLQQHHIDKASFSNLMSRLQPYSYCMGLSDENGDAEGNKKGNKESDEEHRVDTSRQQRELSCRDKVLAGEVILPAADADQWSHYLSSHPATSERLEKFQNN